MVVGAESDPPGLGRVHGATALPGRLPRVRQCIGFGRNVADICALVQGRRGSGLHAVINNFPVASRTENANGLIHHDPK